MARKKTTKLTSKMLEAIQMAIEGRSWQHIAEALEVHRETVWKWRRTPIFMAELTAAQEAVYSETSLLHNTYVSNAFAVLHRQAANKDGKYSPEIEQGSAIKLIELTHRNIEVIKIVEQNRQNLNRYYREMKEEAEKYLEDYAHLDNVEIADIPIKDVRD